MTVNKERIFRAIVKNDQKRSDYFDSLPKDVCMAFIENQYVDNLLHERDMLIKLIFGEHADAVEWFLYEWKPGFEVGYDGNMVKIDNLDHYIEWMKANEGFK